MLTLYYAPNTCALASHIALVDAGAPYALKCMALGSLSYVNPSFSSAHRSFDSKTPPILLLYAPMGVAW